MKHIVEHFGMGFLQIISGGICMALIVSQMHNGGILHTIVLDYMQGICG